MKKINEVLESILIVVLYLGFILLLGREMEWWGPEKYTIHVKHHEVLEPDSLPAKAPQDKPLAPVEFSALNPTE